MRPLQQYRVVDSSQHGSPFNALAIICLASWTPNLSSLPDGTLLLALDAIHVTVTRQSPRSTEVFLSVRTRPSGSPRDLVSTLVCSPLQNAHCSKQLLITQALVEKRKQHANFVCLMQITDFKLVKIVSEQRKRQFLIAETDMCVESTASEDGLILHLLQIPK